jgi:hypothetical protein
VDRRRSRRQPGGRRPTRSLLALERGREIALERYRTEVRELAAIVASSRSLVEISAELEESIARDERELTEYTNLIGARNEREPYRRKLSFMWWRLGHDGYEGPGELLADLAVISRSLEANAGGRIAHGRIARARAAGRAVRLPPGEAGRPAARARPRRAHRTDSRSLRAIGEARRRHGGAGARHRDRLGRDLGG